MPVRVKAPPRLGNKKPGQLPGRLERGMAQAYAYPLLDSKGRHAPAVGSQWRLSGGKTLIIKEIVPRPRSGWAVICYGHSTILTSTEWFKVPKEQVF